MKLIYKIKEVKVGETQIASIIKMQDLIHALVELKAGLDIIYNPAPDPKTIEVEIEE